MLLPKTRGTEYGICNICGEYGKLTEDHTPPQGCIKPKAVEIKHIHSHLKLTKGLDKGRIIQKGLCYRTLCGRCNNGILGTDCDPEFIRLVNQIGRLLTSSLHLPPYVKVSIKPQKIMRSLLGHLQAMGVDRYQKGSLTEPLRNYMLDYSLPLPQSLKIYYWIFPFKDCLLARDCLLISSPRMDSYTPVWFVKFFPVAFLVAIEETNCLAHKFKLQELSIHRSCAFEEDRDIFIHLNCFPGRRWPEAPEDHTGVMHGNDAIVSYDYVPEKKKKGAQ